MTSTIIYVTIIRGLKIVPNGMYVLGINSCYSSDIQILHNKINKWNRWFMQSVHVITTAQAATPSVSRILVASNRLTG